MYMHQDKNSNDNNKMQTLKFKFIKIALNFAVF